MDGSLVVYDKEKEDATFLPEENGIETNTNSESTNAGGEIPAKLHVDKSVHSKNQKFNPVSFWKLSNQRINAFAFSPDNRHLAVVSEDGTLRIIDYLKEQYAYSYQIPPCLLTSTGSWICTQATMVVLSASAGLRMANMFLLVVKMIWFLSGQLPNQPLLLDARDINLGSQPFALFRGDAMIKITGSEVLVKTADSFCGTSV